eukprot:TRINITY_DN3296_c0_g2_i1.p1 TRINITY_DN3296_c0_g2~~TRINITY_DN3296_c0_g2_i1.p1  ORF type:complete len:477 (-),score=124.63 TRINITY_DN3296_c0_g2_i1:1701-3131(-)
MRVLPILILALVFVMGLCTTMTKPKIKLAIWGPSELASELGSLNMNIGNFGQVPWGKSLIGHVYPADPEDACAPIKKLKKIPEETSPIVIVKRGSCTFVTKVHYAQIQGAKMVIIVDNKEEDSMYFEMIDDNTGLGQKLNIPGVLISKKEGDRIMEYVNEFAKEPEKKPPVSIAARFDWAKSENVIYEAWISSRDKTSYSFLSRFSNYGAQLVAAAEFTPRYIIWYCTHCEADQYSKKVDNCVSGGRYCAPDPDKDGPLKGYDVVLENLRQICLYKESPLDFFNYTRHYHDLCFEDNLKDLEECSGRAMAKAKIDYKDRIKSCVEDSFISKPGQKVDIFLDDNKVLKEEKKYYIDRGLAIWPSVVINDVLYKGSLNEVALFQTLCASFKRSPDVCMGSGGIVDVTTVSGDINHYRGRRQFWKFLGGIIFLLIIFMIAFFLIYRRIVRRAMVAEMTNQINATVSEYFKMTETSGVRA